ncbi:WD repeat-containing protein 19 [Eumeta japonica]|uniref:WD repeat-containing protein 19 n=1 Tax=Eumeta variegata TaxID=151549 RepID=A0A4C1YLE2_EUMVA|nr:WD repeat-containing protein 19 [Eumeta japonica]
MNWDNDGDILAMITPNSNSVLLWECHANKCLSIETGLREPPSCIAWAHGEPLLAVATIKGNLALYNHHTTKRIPIIGKHTKKITCAAWNKDNILVLASEDKSLSINNSDGDTLRVVALRDLPNDLQFSEMKTDERIAGENTVCEFGCGKRTLYLYNLLNPENPIELAFQQRYGSIVTYKWYGDGYILIGFSAGFVIAVSTHIKEVGEELFQVKNHKDNLTDVAICNSLGQAATCGDGQLKLISIWDNGEVTSSVTPAGGAERCAWSSDGRLLAAAGRAYLSVYVSALTPLYSAYGTRAVTLTSLIEATIYQCVAVGEDTENISKEPSALGMLVLPAEPTLLALGASHVCCVSGAHAWYQSIAGGAPHRRQYPAPLSAVRMATEYAAVLYQGRAMLHTVGRVESQPDRDSIQFPEPRTRTASIVDIHLTADFFIFATDEGDVEFFAVEEWNMAARYRHSCGVRSLHGDVAGTRVVIVDVKRRGHVYSPLTDHVLPIDEFPPNTNIIKLPLESHNTSGLADADGEKRAASQRKHVEKLLALRRFADVWIYCDALDDVDLWRRAGEVAIANLDVEFAIRVYTRLNDVSMVWALEDALEVEELALLCGTLCACLNRGEAAARWFEGAGARGAAYALELHAARGDWPRAAELAATAAPDRLHEITLHRADNLELTADYHEALANYEKSLIKENIDDPKVKEHNTKCEAGIARTAIRCGDVVRGVTTAMKHANDLNLLKDCAQFLEDDNQSTHAASLYEHAGDFEKAASLYIKLKSWLKVETLLPKLNSPSIHIQYAKAKESEGRYNEALKSYLKAQDFESAIRVNLECLEDIDDAVRLVQETKSVHGARMVADYFQKSDDTTSAIKFLVMSLCYDEAFQLARKNGKLQLYGEILIQTSQVRPEDFKSLALHFEGERNYLLAGKFYFHANEYGKAMTHLLKAGGSEEQENDAISIAIDAAAACDDDRLTKRLIEFLLGETDGAPRDPRHLFRLYMAKKQFTEAAKTAVIIGQAECRAGRYREARDVLRSMCGGLRARGLRAPHDMSRALQLLHTYALVRMHVKRRRHDLAARLLNRLATDVEFFPDQQRQLQFYYFRRPNELAYHQSRQLAHEHSLPQRSHGALSVSWVNIGCLMEGECATETLTNWTKRNNGSCYFRSVFCESVVFDGLSRPTFVMQPSRQQHSAIILKYDQVSILTSAVIECSRAGLKHAAHRWARELMRPEYRPQIDAKYVKKIESVVRHAVREAAPAEPTAPCPQCSAPVPIADLHCTHCKLLLPFCLATGLHIEKEDLTSCPECDFPAIMTEFME